MSFSNKITAEFCGQIDMFFLLNLILYCSSSVFQYEICISEKLRRKRVFLMLPDKKDLLPSCKNKTREQQHKSNKNNAWNSCCRQPGLPTPASHQSHYDKKEKKKANIEMVNHDYKPMRQVRKGRYSQALVQILKMRGFIHFLYRKIQHCHIRVKIPEKWLHRFISE